MRARLSSRSARPGTTDPSPYETHPEGWAIVGGAALAVLALVVAFVSPIPGSFGTPPPIPGAAPDSGSLAAQNHAAALPTPLSSVAVHRLASVALAPNRPAYISGQPAWLAYDSAEKLFFVAVPPSSVEAVPGDFVYDPIVVGTIAVGTGPFGVAYDNATGEVFVTNSLSHNVSVIVGSSLRLAATIPVGSGPMGVAFDPVTRDVYVANNGSNNVSIISDTTLAVVASVAVGSSPLGVAADPSTGDVFVANHGSSNLSVISGRTHRVVATVALPKGPYGVTVDDRLHRAYVSEEAASNVSAISDTTYAVLANISVPCGAGCGGLALEGLAYDSGNGLVYVGAGRGTVAVILPTNNSLFAVLNFDPAGVVYDPDTGDICVTNTANATFECAIFYHPAVGGPYTVQFTESGLPAGTQWYAHLDSTIGQSNGTTIAISSTNGSFPFVVDYSGGYGGYAPDPAAGLVTVAGANVTVPIHFAKGHYLVNVTETGLPAGTQWSAELGSATSYTTTHTNWFNVTNGTYGLALGAAGNYSGSPITSAVTVNGKAVVVNVTYSGPSYPLYAVVFTETGLAAGTPWTVTLGGVTNAGVSSSIAFSESNGTYGFAVAATGYSANPALGNETVHGHALTLLVAFTGTALWQITFHETGLPNGTDWGVLIGSEAQSSTTSDLTFARLNGTYGYLVLSVSGYVTSSPGSVVVNGSNQVIPVRFHPQLYPIVFIELGLPVGSNWSVTVTDNATGYNQTQSSTTSSIIFFLPNGTYAVSFALPSGYNGTASSTSITVAGRAATGATVSVGSSRGPTPPPPPSGLDFALLALAPVAALAALVVIVALVLHYRRPPNAGGRP